MSRRWALLLTALAASPAPMAWAADGVLGTWQGHYSCAQGDTALTLRVRPGDHPGELTGTFHFQSKPGQNDVPEGCFLMSGTFSDTTRTMNLSAGRWLLRPPGYVTVDLSGQLEPDGDHLSGDVLGPLCTSFDLQRASSDRPEDAKACSEASTVASMP